MDNHNPTTPGTLDPESAQPAPHIPMAQHCSEPSLTCRASLRSHNASSRQENRHGHPEQVQEHPPIPWVTSTLCSNLHITVWIRRRGSRLHFWSGVGWCCCFSCQNLPSSIYTAQQGHHIRKSSRELLEIECWPYRDANSTSGWSLPASGLMTQIGMLNWG